MTSRSQAPEPHVHRVPRRRVLTGGAAVAGGALVGASLGPSAASAAPGSDQETVRPPRLRPGDTVRLVSPGSSPNAAQVARGVELLQSWGLRVDYAEHALTKYGYLAAPDADRLADLNAAFADPAVRGVLCTRGGYGTQRIVDGIDLGVVRRDPKVVLGFSDITSLQMWLYRNTGLATVHGPMVAWNDSRTGPAEAEALRRAMMTTDEIVIHRNPADPSGGVVVPGRATGVLLGGNVSLLSQAVGCRDFPGLEGAILFLEEVGEAPYRIDRMLTQLRRSGVLEGLSGVALGQYIDCVGAPDTWTVGEMLRDRLGDLGVPVLGGLPLGHGTGQLTIPFGTRAAIDTDAGTLTAAPAVRD